MEQFCKTVECTSNYLSLKKKVYSETECTDLVRAINKLHEIESKKQGGGLSLKVNIY